MNLKNFLIAAIVLIGFTGFAQEVDQERECKRNRFLAGEEVKINNYKGAAMYYLRAEKLCEFDEANYKRLTVALKNAIIDEKDEAKKKAYNDTLANVYARSEKAGFVGSETYLDRAQIEMARTKPDVNVTDDFFVKGMKAVNNKYDESTALLYYYNLLLKYNATPAKEKPAMKKRYITEYFNLSRVASDRGFSVKTQETLSTYLNYVVKTCEDILPELKGFMSELPQEKEAKVATVTNFLDLLDKKNCQDSKEYEMLLDTIIRINPGYESMIKMARLQVAKGNYSGATATYRDAKGLAPDAEAKEDIDFEILKMQYRQRSYKTAYNTAMSISGKNRSEALKMAAGCVAATANGCGNSTIERKFNYYYASDLMSRAGIGGKYTNNFPTKSELFDAGFSVGQSVNLPCWGVNVTIR